MLKFMLKHVLYVGIGAAFLWVPVLVSAQQPAAKSQAEIALQYKPVQEGVEYTIPTAEDAASCKARKIEGGLRIIDGNGITLREIIDTTGDKIPDEWRYFSNGLEVYREIDTDGDKKKNAFHWYNTSGTRFGTDSNDDGKIDVWQILSVQELTSEIALALAANDAARFEAVLLTPEELKELQLGEEKYSLIKDKLLKARDGFTASAAALGASKDAKWMQFNGTRPSAYPAGTDGAAQDVEFYENASAVLHDGDKDIEIAVGTLIRVGNVWKAIDAPIVATPENINEIASNNVFIRFTSSTAAAAAEGGAQNSEELTKLDEQIAAAQTITEIGELQAKRADLLETMAKNAANPEERAQWIHNLADGITGAIQQGTYPDGVARMTQLLESLKASEDDKSLAAYVQFRLMSSEYTLAMMKSTGTGWLQVRTKWLEDLTKFISDYPDAPDAAEAMLQLGMENENDGESDKALALYSQIVTKFPESTSAVKAKGAVARLESEGKPLTFAALVMGETTKQVTVGNVKGRVIVLHFWASWMGDAAREMDALKAVAAKYPNEVLVMGVNLDDNLDTAKQFVEANHMSWYQLREDGGMESRPANALGIFNVPTIFVIGADGNVISKNALSSELLPMVAEAAKKVTVAPAKKP